MQNSLILYLLLIEISIIVPICWYYLVDLKILRSLEMSDKITDTDKYLFLSILKKKSASIYLMSVLALFSSILYYIKCIKIETNYIYLIPFVVFVVYFMLTFYFIRLKVRDIYNSNKLK